MRQNIDLFPSDQIVGIFRGFREGGLEFHADLALPYRIDFHTIPMHGQFVLVQLESSSEGVLGRITSLSSEGRLTGASGEEFNIRALREGRDVPEQLREDYLKYRVDIRVLGVLRKLPDGSLSFVASHRRLPHVGSPIAFLGPDLLREVAGHNLEGAAIGHLAMGEYIFAGRASATSEPWMQLLDPEVLVKFPVSNLVARRTFVFARAGFGKSNLNKLLFSRLYGSTPTVRKRGGREVPVGTILFDPDGEYFWPDDKDRPGLCDVPALQDQLVVFTSREAPSQFYGSFVAGGIKLDIRRMRPADVVSLALPQERQDQQNVAKIRGLQGQSWSRLVDLIDQDRNGADLTEVSRLLNLTANQEVEAIAARSNMTRIVAMLHDRTSQFMDLLLAALSDGKLCIVDVSQLRGGPSLVLSGLILRRIFDRNQEEFTRAEPRTIPTIAVVEEAQSVLNDKAPGSQPYVEWVKEGRKYDLGALLITQQPGAIPTELLSQGDNWFLFHLLSAADLRNVKSANAHFSDDLLSSLLNEPIPGQGVFWSSVGGKPYPVPLRALLFETEHDRADPGYSRPEVSTYAARLRRRFADELAESAADTTQSEQRAQVRNVSDVHIGEVESAPDAFQTYKQRAIQALRNNTSFHSSFQANGIPYGAVVGILRDNLPDSLEDKAQIAYDLVPEALNVVLGENNWSTERRGTRDGRTVSMVVRNGLGI